jgi:hypothetical protein
MPRGGDDEDNPDMSLQSTAALATSLLHDGLMPSSPAFRLLMRLSFRSLLAIWRFLCCLRVAHCFFTSALFRLKIASSGRGAFAGTR